MAAISCLLIFAWFVWPTAPEPHQNLEAQPPDSVPDQTSPGFDFAKFFDEHVQQAIMAADRLNKEAANRCLHRIEQSFTSYRRGIGPFTEDMTSWGTRFKVLGRMPKDWWYEREDVREMIRQKFEKHIFSEKLLHDDLTTALAKLKDELEANRHSMLASIKAAVSEADLPELPLLDDSSFAADVSSLLDSQRASDPSVHAQNFLLTELSSGLGGFAARQLVVAIGTRIATMVTATGASAGGATAGGAAAGGGGGSVGGPAGVAIGFGVGLVVGVAVDWWMSSSFESKLHTELNAMIDEIQDSVVAGDRANPGLKECLDDTCEALRESYRQALYVRIVEAHASE